MGIMNNSKYPQRSSFISCATGGTSFNHTSFFTPSDAPSPFSSLSSAGSSVSSPVIEHPLATFAEEPSQMKTGPSPRKRGRKRTKVADPSHIPRPPNCFIQFRREWVAAHRDSELAKGNTKTLSKLAGEAWNRLSRDEKAKFMDSAKEAKKKHEEEFPGYRYEPKRKTPRDSSSSSKVKRSPSTERDPNWVPSILRGSNSSSTCSERSSIPPSDMYTSTDESEYDSINTPYYSRGSSVDLSYSPESEVPPTFPTLSGSFSGSRNGFIQPPKDDRTPTQADFAYNVQSQMLPGQQTISLMSYHPSTSYPNVIGAANNTTQGLAILPPQYDATSSLHSSSQASSYVQYHSLPLQQVAQSLPSSFEAMSHSHSQPSSQGAAVSCYDELQYPPTHMTTSNGMIPDTTTPAQWEQNSNSYSNDNSLYDSAISTTAPQFASASTTSMAAPFSDFLGIPITPLSRLIYDQEMGSDTNSDNGNDMYSHPSPEELMDFQDRFVAPFDGSQSQYWADGLPEGSSGWNVPN